MWLNIAEVAGTGLVRVRCSSPSKVAPRSMTVLPLSVMKLTFVVVSTVTSRDETKRARTIDDFEPVGMTKSCSRPSRLVARCTRKSRRSSSSKYSVRVRVLGMPSLVKRTVDMYMQTMSTWPSRSSTAASTMAAFRKRAMISSESVDAGCSTTPPRLGEKYHVCGREWRSVSVSGTRTFGTPQLPVEGGRNLKRSVIQSAVSIARPRGSGFRFIALLPRPPALPSAANNPKS